MTGGAREPEPWVALLPGLDPTTMGWKRRDWYLPPGHVPLLFDRNGNAGPAVWVDGRIVGGWVQRRNGEIATRLLDDVGREQRTRSTPRPIASPRCSATGASRSASPLRCRRS